MPLIIPKTLPAYDALYEENVFVMHTGSVPWPSTSARWRSSF